MDQSVVFFDKRNLLSWELLYDVEGYCTYKVSVSTGSYSGITSFCLSKEMRNKSIETINHLLENFQGSFCIEDWDSDSFIKFTFTEGKIIPKLKVNGQLGGSHLSTYLVFSFEADQTLLMGLKRQILDNLY